MYPCEPVEPQNLRDLPVQLVMTHPFPCTPKQLFASFARAEDWKAWMDLDVVWTSQPPHGPGATRTVRSGGATFDETFTQWTDGDVMGFYFSAGSLPILQQFAEEYRVRQTQTGCELTWTVGIRMRWWARPAGRIMRAILRHKAKKGFPILQGLVEA